jgi:predicted component of type VI protein secretion system
LSVARTPNYALRFVAGQHKGGEFPLRPNREVIIGRGSEFDMVLDEDMVSRRHARLATYHGQIVLQDLKSTNGTFVNGERISVSRLKVGDRVLIGNSVMELVETDRPASVTIPPPDGSSPGFDPDAVTQHNVPPVPPPQPTVDAEARLSGRVPDEGVTVPDLIELFHASRRSGVLNLKEPGGGEGRVLFREGHVYFAALTEGRGKRIAVPPPKALFRLAGWSRADFRLDTQASLPVLEGEITHDTAALLAEVRQQWEQLAPYAEHLPPRDAKLALTVPLEPRLSALSAEALETLQLVVNHGQVGAVLDRSEATDLETWLDLLYLIQNGYVTQS